MDHGKLTDHNGRTVDFRNVVLIMTSNAGASEQAATAMGLEETEEMEKIQKPLKKYLVLNLEID